MTRDTVDRSSAGEIHFLLGFNFTLKRSNFGGVCSHITCALFGVCHKMKLASMLTLRAQVALYLCPVLHLKLVLTAVILGNISAKLKKTVH